MVEILAATSKLQVQYQQLEERNKRLEAALEVKAKKLQALHAQVKQREKLLAALKLKVKQAEVALSKKAGSAMGQRERTSSKVKLNVGGHHFMTSMTTLTATELDSMLAAMFSGQHKLKRDNKGHIFIWKPSWRRHPCYLGADILK